MLTKRQQTTSIIQLEWLMILIWGSLIKVDLNKTGVVNDPLGQTHSHASSEHCFLLFCFSRFEKWRRTDNMCEKTMIPTGSDFGLVEWINKTGVVNAPLSQLDSPSLIVDNYFCTWCPSICRKNNNTTSKGRVVWVIKFARLVVFEKLERTVNICENNDRFRPGDSRIN